MWIVDILNGIPIITLNLTASQTTVKNHFPTKDNV